MNFKTLLPLIFVVFIDLLGFGIVIPILPYLAISHGATGITVGLLMMVYSLMQFIMAPLWGGLSDIYGRKKILLISIFGIACSLLLLGFSHSLTWIFIGRILAGFFAANISVAYAYVSDCTTAEKRTHAMGLLGASFGLGFIFGPAIGGLLAGNEHNYSFVFLFTSALSFINLILAFFLLKEPLKNKEERKANRSKRWDFTQLKLLFKNKKVSLPIFYFFLTTLAVTQLEVTFALFLKQKFLIEARQAGLFLAFSGFTMVFTQGYLIKKITPHLKRNLLISVSSLLCILGLFLFALSSSIPMLLLSLFFLGIGHGLIHPSLSAEVSIQAGDNAKGFTMGWFHSAASLARIIGPICAGWFFDVFSIEFPFYIACLFLVPIFLLNLRANKT